LKHTSSRKLRGSCNCKSSLPKPSFNFLNFEDSEGLFDDELSVRALKLSESYVREFLCEKLRKMLKFAKFCKFGKFKRSQKTGEKKCQAFAFKEWKKNS